MTEEGLKRFTVTVEIKPEKQVVINVTRDYSSEIPVGDVKRMEDLAEQLNQAVRLKYGTQNSEPVLSVTASGSSVSLKFAGPKDLLIFFTLTELLDIADDRIGIFTALNPHMPSISGVPEGGK